jgi:hypothetical protein
VHWSGGVDELLLSDFGIDDVDGPDDTALEGLLDDMVGCDSVKEKLADLRDLVQFAQARGEDPKEKISYNYLFTGKPGTG